LSISGLAASIALLAKDRLLKVNNVAQVVYRESDDWKVVPAVDLQQVKRELAAEGSDREVKKEPLAILGRFDEVPAVIFRAPLTSVLPRFLAWSIGEPNGETALGMADHFEVLGWRSIHSRVGLYGPSENRQSCARMTVARDRQQGLSNRGYPRAGLPLSDAGRTTAVKSR
jgi:hypothetical protein